MERAFIRTHLIGMPWFQRESAPPILKAYSGVGDDDARPEKQEVRLDIGDHHTIGIGGGEIDCIAWGWGAISWGFAPSPYL